MFDGGFHRIVGSSVRPVVARRLGSYHPHVTAAVYDALFLRLVSRGRCVLLVQGRNFGSPATTRPAAARVPPKPDRNCRHGDGARHRRGDCRLRPTDGRSTMEATILPSRFPNLPGQRFVGHRGGWRPTSRRTTCVVNDIQGRWPRMPKERCWRINGRSPAPDFPRTVY